MVLMVGVIIGKTCEKWAFASLLVNRKVRETDDNSMPLYVRISCPERSTGSGTNYNKVMLFSSTSCTSKTAQT